MDDAIHDRHDAGGVFGGAVCQQTFTLFDGEEAGLGQLDVQDLDLERIAGLRRLLEAHGRNAVEIIIDGGVTQELLPRYRAAGADVFVFGTAGLFTGTDGLAANIDRIKRLAAG